MLLENENEIIKSIGPFERAKTNLERFAWNFMIIYTVHSIMETYKYIEQGDEDKLKLTKITADATLQGVFQLILEKNNNVWD